MLSALQEEKIRRFFNLLDFDRNGVIEREDFVGIAENLCLLLDIDEGSPQFHALMKKFNGNWDRFNFFVSNNDEKATWEHFKKFADGVIVNGDEVLFNVYVENFVGELFDNFDVDKDGTIDIEEFTDLYVDYRIEVRYAAKAFRNLDRDKNDSISRSELIGAVQEYFRSNNPDAPGNWLFGRG
ncbi:MAG: EF-hand domain-containing protein [Bacteroidota bacterium]